MPIWKITPQGPKQVGVTAMKQEKLLEEHLEDWVMADPSLLGEPLLVIGRQVIIPDVRDRLDILALDPQGNTVIVELKRGQLKDPVDMQALRYASYISRWGFDDLERQARVQLGKVGDPEFNFNELFEEFCAQAGVDEVPDLNSNQRMIIVGAEVKDRLGSVALWLREHSVDIKIIQVEAFKEGETLFIQPTTIIPLPVSHISEVGRASVGESSQPWVSDGKTWHLEKRCSSRTREMLLKLDDLIRDNLEVEGPRWDQKFYVAYRIGNYNWIAVETHPTALKVRILVKPGLFDQAALAQRLGIKSFDQDDSLAEKLGLPSSVMVQHRSENVDRVILRIKEDFDWESGAVLEFLKEAYRAYPK